MLDGNMDSERLEWLEDVVKSIFERKPRAMAFVSILEDGYVLTAYYGANAQDKAGFASNIQADVVMDIIKANAEEINRLLQEPEEGD